MKLQRRRALYALLPPGIYRSGSTRHSADPLMMDPDVESYAAALADPAFGWRFVRYFADQGMAPPLALEEPELVRTAAYLRTGERDSDVLEALALEAARNPIKRILVKCMALLGQLPAEIAQHVGTSRVTVEVFLALFWDVQDRDWVYRASLAFPEGRQPEFCPGFGQGEGLMSLSLRIAMDQGLVALEQWLGLRPLSQATEASILAKEFVTRNLAAANFAMTIGFTHQKLEVFTRAKSMLRLATSMRGRREEQSSSAAEELKFTHAVLQCASHIAGPDEFSVGTNQVGLSTNPEPLLALTAA